MSLKIDENEGLDPDKIENGILVHLHTPDGELSYLGGDESKPKQIRVRSVRCQAVKDADLKEQKLQAAVRGRRNPGKPEIVPNDIFIPKRAAQCSLEFINFSASEPVQKVTFETAHEYFKDPRFSHHRDEVFEAAGNDALFAVDETSRGKSLAGDTSQSTSEG